MAGHGELHTTPSSDEEAEEQVLPVPIEAVHGLPETEQVAIRELPRMSIVVSELITMAESAVRRMARSSP